MKCCYGYLNASGEQGFIEMMSKGIKIKKNFCITSCFRDEEKFDDIHHLYFVKLELIDTDVSIKNLKKMIKTAQEFFNKFLPKGVVAKCIPTPPQKNTFDIVDSVLGIELGSYGIRKYKNLKWIYGTGIALPRLDTVIQKIKQKQGQE